MMWMWMANMTMVAIMMIVLLQVMIMIVLLYAILIVKNLLMLPVKRNDDGGEGGRGEDGPGMYVRTY